MSLMIFLNIAPNQLFVLDKNGNEIEFNGGMTWIQVIPDEDYLRY